MSTTLLIAYIGIGLMIALSGIGSAYVVTSETIQTLCTGKSGEHEEVTELVGLLQCTESCITSDSYTIS